MCFWTRGAVDYRWDRAGDQQMHTGDAGVFCWFGEKMPVRFIEGLGVESGVDPLDTLWRTFHDQKNSLDVLAREGDELGVTHPCAEEGYFTYFAGGKSDGWRRARGI